MIQLADIPIENPMIFIDMNDNDVSVSNVNKKQNTN